MPEVLPKPRTHKILIVFGGVALYGMERGVIETFDLLRPEVEPHFLISQTPKRLGFPLFDEIQGRHFRYSFLSDHTGWERLAKPRSVSQFFRILKGLIRGNLDALREVRRQEMLYVPNLFAGYYSLLALMFCRLTGRRTFYHFHDLYSQRSRQLGFLSLFISDFIHNTSYGFADVSKKNPVILKKRNSVIPYPVMHQPEGSVQSKPNGGPTILFVGQVARHKGVDILLDAFQLLAETHPGLTLNLLGGCEDPQLRRKIEEQQLKNNCRMKWWGYRKDVADFLKSAYVYVHPSPGSRFSESFGIGMLEAMASGVPGVCFKSGALREVVVNKETGLICDEETPEALGGAIEQFLNDNKFRDKCGQRAKQRFQERYSHSMIKHLWLGLLNQERSTQNG